MPDLGFNLFSFHVVEEKHEITLNKTGAHLLNGRLVFPLRNNGSSLRATRVIPGGHASASNALTTFADPPSHRSDGPPPLYGTEVQLCLGVGACLKVNTRALGRGALHKEVDSIPLLLRSKEIGAEPVEGPSLDQYE